MIYENEIKALKRAGRFRERKLYDDSLRDLASNDYLGLSTKKKQLKKAIKLLEDYQTISPKSSMLVNGYHPVHRIFEMELAEANGFEEGMIVGSGFLANMALIESLVRKGDRLFMDEEYHASGVLASQLLGDRVVKFRHNDAEDLKEKLEAYPGKRQIVAIEGVYSMSGELAKKEIFDLAEEKQALLIVDEAHSAGVLGWKLQGIFEHYGIPITERHIKMGTLGKAYGSYGAYILASKEVISFLENRAKPVIYSTAPSVIDTALALVNFRYILKKADKIRAEIKERQAMVAKEYGIHLQSLILPIRVQSNDQALFLQKGLMAQGYLTGAIRQPTVSHPIMRVILSLSVPLRETRHALALIYHNLD
ncbi:MAG: pyridoxal phosphate-dependent aminotransferase family protein [Sulfurovum sp.]|nr:pyridoxal phosphate-dependent aminotransferase family protein [Sulfurovum sp.]